MATNKKKRGNRLRKIYAAVASTAALSLVSTTTPMVASAQPLDNIDEVLSSSSTGVADLAGLVADVQAEVQRVEGEIGYYRELVNQALMNLNDARTEAAQARRGAEKAREDLNGAQSDLETAQGKLDDLSQTAYRRANASQAITAASGAEAREIQLERQAYLRTETEKQQGVVDDLERVRTQKANQESTLRKAQQLADAREERAVNAEAEARRTLDESLTQVEERNAERERLVEEQERVQTRLNQERGLDEPADDKSNDLSNNENDRSSRQASNVDSANTERTSERSASQSREVSEQALTPRESTSREPESVTVDAEDATESRSQSTSSEETSEASSEAAATSSEASESGSSVDASAVEDASSTASDMAETSSQVASELASNEDLQQLAVPALGAAAAIVGSSQPDHAGSLGDWDFDAMAETSSQLMALQGEGSEVSEEESELAGSLDGVLEGLEDSNSVTEEASEEVSDMGRDQLIESVIARAESQIGVPYAWGGGDANGPTKGIRDGGTADSHGDYNKVGFDCSGLVLYAFAAAGISLPHYTGSQYQHGEKISPDEMQRGDLIFYGPSGNHHVAIYLGDGMMLEAPQSGQNVQKTPVRYSGMSPHAVRLL